MFTKRLFRSNLLLVSGLLLAGYSNAEAGNFGGGHLSAPGGGFGHGILFRGGLQTYHPRPSLFLRGAPAYGRVPADGSHFPGFQTQRQVARQMSTGGICGPIRCMSKRDVPSYSMPTSSANPYSAPGPGAGGGLATTAPAGATYVSTNTAGPLQQLRYTCTIASGQPDAGGACLVTTSIRRQAGDRCKCGRETGTID